MRKLVLRPGHSLELLTRTCECLACGGGGTGRDIKFVELFSCVHQDKNWRKKAPNSSDVVTVLCAISMPSLRPKELFRIFRSKSETLIIGCGSAYVKATDRSLRSGDAYFDLPEIYLIQLYRTRNSYTMNVIAFPLITKLRYNACNL